MREDLLVNIVLFGVILLGYITLVFIIAQIHRDNSVMDIAYGPAFFCSAIGTLLYTHTYTVLPLVITGLLGLWSTRLGLRIYKKNYGKPEDIRYAQWRNRWMEHGYYYFLLRSFLQINLLQGVIIVIVALPFIISLSSPQILPLPFLLIGIGIFISGFIIESLADHQLDAFLRNKRAGTESAVLMTTGLFRFSRRPNYFGETLIWWGLAVIVLPLPYGYTALLSPLLITYIVTRVTGPMLEKIFLDKYPLEYRNYMKRTSYFFPWLPKHTQTVISETDTQN